MIRKTQWYQKKSLAPLRSVSSTSESETLSLSSTPTFHNGSSTSGAPSESEQSVHLQRSSSASSGPPAGVGGHYWHFAPVLVESNFGQAQTQVQEMDVDTEGDTEALLPHF